MYSRVNSIFKTRLMLKRALILFVLSTTFTANSQNWGVKIGIQQTGLSKTSKFLRSVYHIGPFFEIPINNTFYVNTGLQFERKGGGTLTIDYLELPLYSVVNLFGNRAHLEAGGYMAYGVRIFGLTSSGKFDMNFGDGLIEYERHDYGIHVGMGINVNEKLQLSLGYDQSFVEIDHRPDRIEMIRTFNFSMFIRFPKNSSKEKQTNEAG